VVRSVVRPGVRVNVHWCPGGVEVLLIELGGGKSLSEPSLHAMPSWHLVLEGQARFQIGERSWELLPEESLSLDRPGPLTIINPARDRLRVLCVLCSHVGEMEA
jgi:mannose-6-phosphate isomerase-like protein (cupin superfamily)